MKNDTLVYRKTGRKVPKEQFGRIIGNRVYDKNNRLKGYIGKEKVKMLPRSKRRTFTVKEGKGLIFEDTGRKATALYLLRTVDANKNKFVVLNRAGTVVGSLKSNFDYFETIRLFYGFEDTSNQTRYYDIPEIELPHVEIKMPKGFTEEGLDPFFSDYKEVVQTFGPLIGNNSGLGGSTVDEIAKALGPGVISVTERSYINFANALDAAVNTINPKTGKSYLTEEEARKYFKWYSFADDKQKGELWDELYDYYETLDFDYFD